MASTFPPLSRSRPIVNGKGEPTAEFALPWQRLEGVTRGNQEAIEAPAVEDFTPVASPVPAVTDWEPV